MAVKNIELLIKPVSSDCNMECRYCFYRSTNKIYPASKHLMDPKVLEVLLSKSLSYSDGGLAIFSWQGGEPLLAGIDFFNKVINWQGKLGKTGQRIGNSIQTNGLLLTEKWINLFQRYNFLIGVSLDGTEETHDHFRPDSFQKAMASIALLKQAGMDFNILTVVNDFNVKGPAKLYDFFKKNNMRYLQLIPCAEKDENGNIASFSVDPEAYGEFLCGFFDLWYNNGNPKIGVRFFDNILEVLSGIKPGCCGFKEKCGDYLVIEHNGDVYPCDFFVKTEWKLGNILDSPLEKLTEKAKENFGQQKSVMAKKCQQCQWCFICHGGCLKYRVLNNNAEDYFCESYKMFFEHSIDKLKDIILKYKVHNENTLH